MNIDLPPWDEAAKQPEVPTRLKRSPDGSVEVSGVNIRLLVDQLDEAKRANTETLNGLTERAFNTVRDLINSVHHGKITEEQFGTGIDSIFAAVGGLLSSRTEPNVIPSPNAGVKFIDLITSCQEETSNIYPFLKRVFFNGTMTKVFKWQAGDDFLTMTTCSSAGIDERKVPCKNAAEARDKLANMASGGTLSKLGYREV